MYDMVMLNKVAKQADGNLKIKLFFCLVIILMFPFFVLAKNYPDGTLIRGRGDIKVFLIKGNKKQWIKSLEIFKVNNFKWRNVKVISPKEVAAIKEEIIISTPISTITPSPSPSVAGSPDLPNLPPVILSPSITPPISAKINPNLPAPDYIRADWLISHTTYNFGRVGQKITFKYSDKAIDRIENFRLYEKRPGSPYFTKIAEFEEMLSTGCEDIDLDGEWMMTEAAPNQCGYWAIQRIILPGGRGMTAYLPAANYSEGEYGYYVVGVDKDGLETLPSSETKLVFLTTVGIFNPADNQPSTEAYPTFKWSVAGGWPASPAGGLADSLVANYLILISDDKNAQSPFWAKTLKVTTGKADHTFTYDGSGLSPAKKYQVYIYGHYRQSEHHPDYISIPLTIPEFWIKTTGQRVSLWNFLKALLFRGFAF